LTKTLTRLIRTAALAALCALALAVSASPATGGPCWKKLINDWYDGRIDKIYPKQCYRQAIKHLPKDAEIYSNARSDIERALLAAQLGKLPPPNRGNRGGKGSGNPGTGATGAKGGVEPTGGDAPQSGLSGRLLDKLGPSKADSVPVPLLVLGGLALLLMAAGGAGVIARRVQEKRAQPPEA
jgi:hypothetical protein